MIRSGLADPGRGPREGLGPRRHRLGHRRGPGWGQEPALDTPPGPPSGAPRGSRRQGSCGPGRAEGLRRAAAWPDAQARASPGRLRLTRPRRAAVASPWTHAAVARRAVPRLGPRCWPRKDQSSGPGPAWGPRPGPKAHTPPRRRTPLPPGAAPASPRRHGSSACVWPAEHGLCWWLTGPPARPRTWQRTPLPSRPSPAVPSPCFFNSPVGSSLSSSRFVTRV